MKFNLFKQLQNPRHIWCIIFIICTLSMGYAFYAEYVLQLKPCNLCMLQRGSMTALGLVAFLACILRSNPKYLHYIFSTLASLFALSGVILASRHLWLQHLPKDQVPACGPDFEFLMAQFPISEVLIEIFQGSGDCAEVKWQFLGLSMPEVLWIVFLSLFIASVWQFFLGKK